MATKKNQSNKRTRKEKPGPKEETLILEGDPEEMLNNLLKPKKDKKKDKGKS